VSDFVAENPLEEALIRAARDPVSRPDFYRALNQATLFIIDENPGERGHGQRILEQDTTLSIRHVEVEGTPHVAVFSSVRRIEEAVSSPVAYVGIGALDLFRIVAGAHILLNPGAAYGKQFTPDEVGRILDGSILKSPSSYVVEQETQVLLGQPAEYPSHITEGLKRFFATRPGVKAAYLAHYHNPSRADPPHTLIGIETSEDWDPLIGEASLVLDGVARPTDIVDFIKIGGPGVSEYLVNDTQPFYRI
jgi:hypothetical protein